MFYFVYELFELYLFYFFCIRLNFYSLQILYNFMPAINFTSELKFFLLYFPFSTSFHAFILTTSLTDLLTSATTSISLSLSIMLALFIYWLMFWPRSLVFIHNNFIVIKTLVKYEFFFCVVFRFFFVALLSSVFAHKIDCNLHHD